MGSPGRPREGELVGWGARLPGAAQPPLPGLRWKARCVLDSRILKVGRWARSRRPRTAPNCERAFNSCSQSPRQPGSREQRGLRARAGPPWTRLEEQGVGPSRALQSRGLGLGPRCTAGGAEAWPLAARGSGPCASLQGAWHSPASPQFPGRPGPPSSGTPATLSRFSTPTLGRAGVLGRSRTEPPRRVNYSWGSRACSQDLLCPQLLRRSGENTGEKLPQQSWPHFSFFPK